MEGKRKPTLSELRVGIFVVAAGAVLAVAIFTIGNQVGLLEETFLAKTYLNNVSGLKPGDLVRLGGVDVGNIVEVRMSRAEDGLPQTQANARTQQEIQELTRRAGRLQTTLPTQGQLEQLESAYDDAVDQHGLDSRQASLALANLNGGRRRVRVYQDVVERMQRAQANLQNIVVYMQISSDYRGWIKGDSHISLGSIGLLGDKYIEVSLGRSDDPPQVVQERVRGALGSEEREVVVITGELQTGFQELVTGANDILANFETLSDKLVELIDTVQSGEGTIGRFITDDTLFRNLNSAVGSAKQTADEAAQLIRDVSKGEGTIPALIRDRQLYDRFVSAADRLQNVLNQIEQGQGTLGQLISDKGVYEKTDRTIANVERITKRMADGQGTLGKLSADDKLYTDLQESVDKVAALLADVEQGKGTLGRLAKDEQLYQNINELSSELVKLIYDFRQNPKRFLTIKFELF